MHTVRSYVTCERSVIVVHLIRDKAKKQKIHKIGEKYNRERSEMFSKKVFGLMSIAASNIKCARTIKQINDTLLTYAHQTNAMCMSVPIVSHHSANNHRWQIRIEDAQQTLPCRMQRRSFSSNFRKEVNFKVVKGNELIRNAIETKRANIREKKEVFVHNLRDKKTKVQEKVKEMEEIVERENILTIPNLLCAGRALMSPYLGYVIVQEQFTFAIGLLVVAGLSDLVRTLAVLDAG